MVDSDSSFSENLKENAFEMWFDSALEEKGLRREHFERGVVELRSPFAGSQYDDLAGGETDVRVRVNDDATDVKLETRSMEIDGVQQQVELPVVRDLRGDTSYFVMIKEGEQLLINFDFRRNKSYIGPLLDAADEFIDLAEFSIDNEYWRGFVENAFHAAERLMKANVIAYPGQEAEWHKHVRDNFENSVIDHEGKSELLGVYDTLKDEYRKSATYVDPSGKVPDREFELTQDQAESILEIIGVYRDSFDEHQPI